MIEIKNNFNKIIKKFENRKVEIFEAINKGFSKGLRSIESHLITEQLSGRKNDNYGLNRQSGIAANSLDVKVFQDKKDIVGQITVKKNAWYLKVHQHYKFNGYIRPKNATLLTIPIHQSSKGKKSSEFNLFFVKIPGKSPMLFRKKGKKKIELMYILKKKVYVPKRLYFYEDFKKLGTTKITNQINKSLIDLLGKK